LPAEDFIDEIVERFLEHVRMKLPMAMSLEAVPVVQEAAGRQRVVAHHSQLLNVGIPSPYVPE
jgi:hypothetical protein